MRILFHSGEVDGSFMSILGKQRAETVWPLPA
jgi:hypothetical protein